MAVTLPGGDGLRVTLNANGALRRIDQGGLLVNLFPGNEVEGGPANLWLRRLAPDGAEATPLLGPASPLPPLAAVVDAAAADPPATPGRLACTEGRLGTLDLRLQLRVAADRAAWCWHVEVSNRGDAPVAIDVLHAQDVGLVPYGAARLNEYYVSHYLDFTPLTHERQGRVLAVRQNRAVAGRHPWLLLGALDRAVAFASDALQLHGPGARAGLAAPALRAGLPDRRLQHEHAMAQLQSAARTLAPGERARFGFFALLLPDHPQATGAGDLAHVDAALALPEARPAAVLAPVPAPPVAPAARVRSLFTMAALLPAHDLPPQELRTLFGDAWRHEEREGDRLLSFFRGGPSHVVLRGKELAVMRPHGHILRSGDQLVPDEAALTSTAWMSGVFHSMVTQGHVGINRFLSTTRSWLGLFRSQGQRVLLRIDGRWWLLGVPSAFEVTPHACRWWYRHDGGLIEVEARAGELAHELALALTVHEGAPVEWLVTHDVSLGGDDGSETVPSPWRVEHGAVVVEVPPGSALAQRFPRGHFRIEPGPGTVFDRIGGDGPLWHDGIGRGQPFVCVGGGAARAFSLRLVGALVPGVAAPGPCGAPALPRWQVAAASAQSAQSAPLALAQLGEVLPWFLRDALVHYLAPRGLEQFSGGGWGTRDVCQGPLEMLLALGRHDAARDLLCRVLAAQDATGDWPQWFMFFERERMLRADDAHGDVVLWPVLAAARYLLASGDAGWLDERLPFHAARRADAGSATVSAHLERALALARSRRIAGTSLVAYGHGDWNDSLQPADPALREHLCSAWTVTLHHQALTTLARAFHGLGRAPAAAALQAEAEAVAADFRRLLVVDGQVAGYALFPPGGPVEWMLHPRDRRTGLTASLLPMMHAVLADLLAPAEAAAQLECITQRLSAPDGARLFDRPLPYRGGIETLFQRAESSAFFGREIGVMYTHAHLRHAEMLAHLGLGERLLEALALAQPIGLVERVATATRRQANCYYSSSDAAFADRYEAGEHYAAIRQGKVALDGGWRVYSSGPGIMIGAVVERLFGLRREHARLVLDPVLPPGLEGLELRWPHGGCELRVRYHVGARGHGPQRIEFGGRPLAFEREANPYRTGGAVLSRRDFDDAVAAGARDLDIHTG